MQFNTGLSGIDISNVARNMRDETIEHYPFLSRAEFNEICHNFDRQYCHAILGPIRRIWRLRICTALDISLADDGERTIYIQILRPLEAELDDGDLSAQLRNFSMKTGTEAFTDEDAMEVEEADEVDCNAMTYRKWSANSRTTARPTKAETITRPWPRHV
jgi:hypothetical protein